MRLQLKVAIGAAVAALAVPSIAFADGSLEARTVYYLERATRVEQPMLDGMFDVGTRGLLTAHFLVDAITSASAGSGAANGVAFVEHRYEGAAGYTHQIGRAAHAGGDLKYSTESDYRSLYLGAHGDAAFAQKNFVLSGGVGLSLDRVSAASAQGPFIPTINCIPNDSASAADHCTLDVYSGFIGASQVLSRNAVLSLTYDYSRLDGYQANPYRLVVTNTGFAPEQHPDERSRQSIAIGGRFYLPDTATTIIPSYRYYYDNWQIHAHTPELRVVQQAGDSVDATFRYRYYHQSASFFYLPRYPSTDPGMDPTPYLSDDPKMSEFSVHVMEAKLGILGQAFGLDGSAAAIRFEGIMEYIVQTNRFGNAIEGQLAVTFPLTY